MNRRILQQCALSSLLVFCAFKPLAQHHIANAPGKSWTAFFSGSMRLDSLTKYMNTHSVYRFTFNAGKISGRQMIAFTPRVYTLDEALRQIRSATGLTATFHDLHIIFTGTPASEHSTAKKKAPSNTSEPAMSHITTSTHELSAAPMQRAYKKGRSKISFIPTKMDSRHTEINAESPTLIQRDLLKAQQSSSSRDKGHTQHQTDQQPIAASIDRLWHLQAGIFGSEVLYSSVGVEAGISPIYASLALCSDLRRLDWLVGIGSFIVRSQQNQLQTLLNFSSLHEGYSPKRDTFSLSKSYAAKGKYYRLDLLWVHSITSKFILKAGPSLNLLHTAYYFNGIPATTGVPTSQLTLLHPPLLLIHKTSLSAGTDTKMWVGLSVGLFVDLRIRGE